MKIANDNITYDISETEASHFSTLPTISMMVFCPVFAVLCDVIGRKNTLLLTAVTGLTSWLLKAFTTNVNLLYLSRVIVGIDTVCFFIALPLYVGEIASPNVRGLLSSFIISFNFFGQFLINTLGSYFSVRITSYISFPIPIIFFVMFLFMPESPYFYIMKGNHEQAKKSLSKLRGKNNIENEFLKLKSDIERQLTEKGTWKDLVLIKSNRKAILLGIFLRTAQFMGGTATFTSNILFIFDKTSGVTSAPTAAMIYSFFSCIFPLCAGSIMDKVGRRLAFTTSLASSSVVLLLETLYFHLSKFHPEIDLIDFSWVPLVGQILYVILASFGPGVIPTLMISEIFSTSVKAKAFIVMVFTIAFMASLSNFLFFAVYPLTGLGGPFLMFSLMNFIFFVISYFYLPETKGKTLEEIQQILKED